MADDPKKPYKAYLATALAFLVTFGNIWIADSGSFTPKEVVGGLIASAIGSGIVGVGAYAVKNPKK